MTCYISKVTSLIPRIFPGKFLCNLFGIMFTLVVQTKVMLMSGGLFISVIALVSGSKIEHTTAVRISAVVVVLSWVVGIIHAFLPYMLVLYQ